jgi:predicted nucleic acid-binding protein
VSFEVYSPPTLSLIGKQAMSGKSFIDSNVILYLMSEDHAKADQAENVMTASSVVSVQVLNEVTSVARKKLQLSWAQIDAFLSSIKGICHVEPLTLETHDQARFISERYQLSFYDALIVSSALIAKCSTLYSEDMHDKLIVEGALTIRNPFSS